MIAACKQAQRKLMIAYRIQYEPYNRIVQSYLRSGKFGQVRLIESVNAQNQGDSNQWRQKRALAGGVPYQMSVCTVLTRLASCSAKSRRRFQP